MLLGTGDTLQSGGSTGVPFRDQCGYAAGCQALGPVRKFFSMVELADLRGTHPMSPQGNRPDRVR